MAPQIAALPVNVRIIRAREIDAFKDAPTGFGLGQTVRDLQLTVLRHHNCLTGREFHYFSCRAVECSLYGRAFTGYHKHLIIEIIITGADTVRIADGKDGARAGHAAERERTIQRLQRRPQHPGKIDHSGGAGLLAVQVVCYGLQQQVPICMAGRVMPRGQETLIHFCIGRQIEIPGQQEHTTQLCRFMHKGITATHIITPEGRIAQVAQKQLTVESRPIADLPQHIRQRIIGSRAYQLISREPRFGVEMQRRYPRTVLPAIVLLFEQQDKAAEAVILYTIFPFVV